ncbi:hypothetical protein EV360DRAFT_89533 [Lentinula raphanica]|nr:hypothetical protein EV360DRAFT_89533 [Lentinula raphanica]
MDLMSSEYVAPNATIHSLHQLPNVSAPYSGASFILLFLNNPDPPHHSHFPDPIEPISEFHVIVLGVRHDGSVRSVNAENIQPLLDYFALSATIPSYALVAQSTARLMGILIASRSGSSLHLSHKWLFISIRHPVPLNFQLVLFTLYIQHALSTPTAVTVTLPLGPLPTFDPPATGCPPPHPRPRPRPPLLRPLRPPLVPLLPLFPVVLPVLPLLPVSPLLPPPPLFSLLPILPLPPPLHQEKYSHL